MTDNALLAQHFSAHRGHLRAVAYRMLGSTSEADDALQESWLRMSRSGTDDIDNLAGWMTTVVSRVCLDLLRSRNARREDSLDVDTAAPARRAEQRSPEEDAQLADSVGMALRVVLETLDPAERVAFVLHDMFDLTFDEIAPIVGRTTVATRQLASRARRRVRGSEASDADRTRHREVVEAFLTASRAGDLNGLLALLDPDVVARGDAAAVKLGGAPVTRGALAVAETFKGRAQAAVPGMIDDEVGVLVPVKGRMLLVLLISFRAGKIRAIDAVADQVALAEMALVPFGAR